MIGEVEPRPAHVRHGRFEDCGHPSRRGWSRAKALSMHNLHVRGTVG